MRFEAFLAAAATVALSPSLVFATEPGQSPPGRMREGSAWFPGDPTYDCGISIFRPPKPGSRSRNGALAEVIYVNRGETFKIIEGRYTCSVEQNCERPDCNLPRTWNYRGQWGVARPARKNTYFDENGVQKFNTLASESHKRLYDCRVAIWQPPMDSRTTVETLAEATHFNLGESVRVLRGRFTCKAEQKCGNVICNLPEGYKYQSITGGPFQPMEKTRKFYPA